MTPVAAGDGHPPARSGREHARYRIVSDSVHLLDATFERHVYDRHIHDSYAIGFTLRGVQRFWCRGATHDSTPGQVLVIAPGEAHDGQSGAPGGYAYRMFYVSVERVERIVRDAGGDGVESIGVRMPLLSDPSLARMLDIAWRAAHRAPRSLAADELLDDALLAIGPQRPFKRTAHQLAGSAGLHRVREYLRDHPGDAMSVYDLAAIASMSRFQLTRQFQRMFGLPLHAYHMHVRLEEARRRLAHTPISTVAAELGFADQSHLHRRFKGAYGVTPSEWQRTFAALP